MSDQNKPRCLGKPAEGTAGDRPERERAARRMGALDVCNVRWGRGAVVPARAGLARQRRGWATKVEMRTPRCMMRVGELPVARA